MISQYFNTPLAPLKSGIITVFKGSALIMNERSFLWIGNGSVFRDSPPESNFLFRGIAYG